MSCVDGTKLSLKVIINKEKSKVLFAEANSYFADALLGFLTLPLEKIFRILANHETFYGYKAPVIGCLTSACRDLLLNFEKSSWSDDNKPVFRGSGAPICSKSNCPNSGDSNGNKVSDIGICVCGKGRALTIETATFVISDDLRVVPMLSNFLETLNNLGISDIHGAEPKSLSLEIQVVNLLKLSLTSTTSLTDMVFNNSEINSISPKIEPIRIGEGNTNSAKTIILKVLLQKSMNKFLFAEAMEDFVVFLFTVLTFPLGEAVRRLDGKFPFKNIHNLYMSVADFVNENCFRDKDTKTRLINPEIYCGYFSLNPVVEIDGDEQNVFIVNDDLTVERFSIATVVLKLNSLGIPLSDVKEMEMQIGVKEALEILQASLVSKTALTDALINPMLIQLSNPMPEGRKHDTELPKTCQKTWGNQANQGSNQGKDRIQRSSGIPGNMNYDED